MVKKLLKLCIISLAFLIAAAPPALAQTKDESRYLMLVNNQHQLAADDVPQELVALADYLPAGKNVQMTEAAAEAAGRMYAAMQEAGLGDLYGQSGYRDYDLQQLLNQRKYSYLRSLGLDEAAAHQQANTVVALPGSSEHQSGMAIDFITRANGNSLTDSFGETPAGRWLAANSWRYGFILRYASGKEEITGYIYEPWHFRYVGEPHAAYMVQNDLCLEEYYELLAEQRLLIFSGGDGATYAVYFSPGDDADIPGDPAIAVSRAFADTTTGLVFTARVPELDYLDIVAGWAEDYHAMQALTQLAGLPAARLQTARGTEPQALLDLLSRVYLRLYRQGANSGNRQMMAYLEQVLMSAESYCRSGPSGPFFLQPLFARPEHLLNPQQLLADPLDTGAAAGGSPLGSLQPLYLARPELPFAGTIGQVMPPLDPQMQAAVRVLTAAGRLDGGNFAAAGAFDLTWSEISAMLDENLAAQLAAEEHGS